MGSSARTTGTSACCHSELAEGGRTGGSAGNSPCADPRHSPHFPPASRLFPVPADLPSRLTQLPAVTIPHLWPGPPRLNPRGSQHSPTPGPGGTQSRGNCRGFPGHQPRLSILSPVFGTRRPSSSRAHRPRQRTTTALAPGAALRSVPQKPPRRRGWGCKAMRAKHTK